jgi:2-polyprenyl-3-methyl-5-hydroxy-6-metoxy-1,4-benzoquinol methylase
LAVRVETAIAPQGPAASLVGMGPRDRQEAIWSEVPRGLEPADLALRRDFLLSGVAAGDRVLDLGCGEGEFAAAIAAAGADVLAADIAAEPLRRARAAHPGLELELLAQEGEWSLADSSFDFVWAGEVIEHVADTTGWLSEVRRVLRSGGRLLLTTPAVGRAELLAAALSRRAFAERFDPRSDHLRHYSRATLTELISGFGFESIDVRVAGRRVGRRVLLARAVRARF